MVKHCLTAKARDFFFFLHCFLGFCGVFVPQKPCSTANHGAVAHRAGGFTLQCDALGCVCTWDKFGFCSCRSSYSYSIGKLRGFKPKRTRPRLEEAQQGRRVAMRDSCIPLSCPGAAAAPVLGTAMGVWQGMMKRKGGGVWWLLDHISKTQQSLLSKKLILL